jgi:DNA-binding NarL/FixJ family response regulator
MIKVLVFDATWAVRNGLHMRLALEPDLLVVGEAGTASEALALVQAYEPDVVVVDAEMQGMDGIVTLERLRKLVPGVAVVALSLRGDGEARKWARDVGAEAFVVKQEGAEILMKEIRRLAQHSL